MTMARVFTSGNIQAVRLPKEFRVNCAELTIYRRGDEIVLREPPRNLARAFELLSELPNAGTPYRKNGRCRTPIEVSKTRSLV